MVYKDFRFKVALRVILVGITMAAFVYCISSSTLFVTAIIVGVIVIFEMVELFNFISNTNRKLTRFLESVKYSDFSSGFAADNRLGQSFKDLNQAFNEVLEAFRKARSEKEEHLQYLHTVVEHVSTGLMSFDEYGKVELLNATAKRFLKVDRLRNIEELIADKSRLYKVLFDLPTGKSTLYRSEGDIQLSVHATELILRGKKIKLIAFQNIQPELQKKELEAWQNLTRVLRHEIMNSITPIASLTSTMKDILMEDLEKHEDHYTLADETVEDLQDGLITISGRSQGLIRFIDAYRDYTSIPLPKMKPIKVANLLEHISQLMKIEVKRAQINYICEVNDESLELNIDEELIEQVLINLIKNAIEALAETEKPTITLSASTDSSSNIKITITDNGPGIIREALDQIFIPFYSTKKRGSGIGLSLSRQIMQLHNGTLSVISEPNEETEFTLTF
ncbi:sensor histidine kinase [Fulvivirga sediminis]|uniref:histidine kinase n=1 Tax=Fulvivirga sediminis TaxID=2803949 RepID=A0A937K092_9BACT|nr:ATP-binding protein [Fulvivirga sediminis]MBL3657429.1 GHKL domain-containing protein [Fulvivirga sediminis]